MFRQLKKTLVATAIASLTLGSIGPAFADSADTLPDMGTSAGSTLSIGQEMQMTGTVKQSELVNNKTFKLNFTQYIWIY